MLRFLATTVACAVCFAAQVPNSPKPPLKAKAAVAAPKPGSKSALDKATLEAYVRHMMLWGPQVTVAVADPVPAPMPGFTEVKVTGSFQQVSLEEIFYVSKDGRKILRGTVYDISRSPFAAELEKLKTDLQPSMGTAGAPVVIVLFSDFQCAYCREEAKMLRGNLLKTYPKEVRLYFKDMPIDQIHPWARNASIAGRCIFRQKPESFWAYHDWVFDKQTEINQENLRAKLGEWVQANGLDSMQFGRCIDNRSTEPEVNRSIAEARSLKVNSTPTMFINGRMLPGSVPWEQMKNIVDWELDYSKKTGATGEACCEAKLPTPGGK